jgi:hypothetical protein
MSDNITLPRVVVKRLVASWGRDTIAFIVSMGALRAALAEPEKERAETVIPARCVAGSEKPASSRDELYRTTEPDATREPATEKQIIEACGCSPVYGQRKRDFYEEFKEIWSAAERFHGIGGSKT